MRIVCIGSGNLATNLTLAWKEAGILVEQVFSRTEANARALAERLGCAWTSSTGEIINDADLYLFSLKDSALETVASRLPGNSGLWVHTAGSMPLSALEPFATRRGVLYPLQTFSKGRRIDLGNVPFFLEANSEEDGAILEQLARAVSRDVRFLPSEKRRHLHLAAVFACNFVNHIYALADDILREEGIPFEVLLPLIDETAAKVHRLTPREAQTGPAIRYDENVINKHLAMLDKMPELKALYETLSRSIHKEANK